MENTITNRIYFLVSGCSFVLSVCPVLYGQATGSFSGTVLDKSESSISGATVTATSQGTSLSRESKTDGVGHYLIPLLPVGIYTLQVEFAGFQPAEVAALKHSPGEIAGRGHKTRAPAHRVVAKRILEGKILAPWSKDSQGLPNQAQVIGNVVQE